MNAKTIELKCQQTTLINMYFYDFLYLIRRLNCNKKNPKTSSKQNFSWSFPKPNRFVNLSMSLSLKFDNDIVENANADRWEISGKNYPGHRVKGFSASGIIHFQGGSQRKE